MTVFSKPPAPARAARECNCETDRPEARAGQKDQRRSIGRAISRVALGAALVAGAGRATAEPAPGDVFREFVWRPKYTFERMTSPEAKAEGAKKHLPNPVNEITLADLDGASRLEVQIELLQSHAGTIGQAIRLNGGEWIPIPPSERIPGRAGKVISGANGPEQPVPQRWLSMRYPCVPLPLAAAKPGANTFELTCRPGYDLGAGWPQSIYHGVIFRVYYAAPRNAPGGRVLEPPPMRERGMLPLAAEVKAAPGRAIRRVDFLGRYDGYDWRGEGIRLDYHYQTHYGELRHHAGSATAAPWQATWDVRWLPAQTEPVQVVARIEDDAGLCTLTAPLVLSALRGNLLVRVFAAHDIPPRWQTRAGRRHECKVMLPDNLERLREARIILATWNGEGADTIGVNDVVLVRSIGGNHHLSYDEITVPISALRPGENTFFTASASPDHGIEVLWPAFTVMARFAPEPAKPLAPKLSP